jgi:thymidylate synthase
MHVLTVRNVCQALTEGVALLRGRGAEENTRGGKVWVMPTPVTTAILSPAERVLFSAKRDANPAFHLFEAIWMLAGRNDVAPLNHFIRDFGDRFGESDGTMHGAYGHRWREALGYDQLDEVVTKLKRDRTNRQAVIQMWDGTPSDYVLNPTSPEKEIFGSDDLRGEWKDRPCNTHIYLRLRQDVLDITICCRSNDVIWGAYGANAVHFSILQEYLAARIGVGMGTLYQISNNFHGYLSTIDKGEERDNRYLGEKVHPRPMFTRPDYIDVDVQDFMECFDTGAPYPPEFMNPWFHEVLVPAVLSYKSFRDKDLDHAINLAAQIKAEDWKLAFIEWYIRRRK